MSYNDNENDNDNNNNNNNNKNNNNNDYNNDNNNNNNNDNNNNNNNDNNNDNNNNNNITFMFNRRLGNSAAAYVMAILKQQSQDFETSWDLNHEITYVSSWWPSFPSKNSVLIYIYIYTYVLFIRVLL